MIARDLGPTATRRTTSWTAWDRREAARAFGLAAGALGFAWLVTGATDEGGVAWSARAARVLPLAPACAALGTWLGQARTGSRREQRALAALGRSPGATSLPAVVGGALVAWAVVAALSLPGRLDVSGFFPVAHAPGTYVSLGGGVFLDAASGDHVEADGSVTRAVEPVPRPASLAASTPRLGRSAAAAATFALGLALPLLVARGARGSGWQRAAMALVGAAATTLLFQAAAAHAVSALAAPLPALALLAIALARGGAWRPRF